MNRKQCFIAMVATLLITGEALWANAQPRPQTQQSKEKDKVMYAILFRVVVKPEKRQEFINFINWD